MAKKIVVYGKPSGCPNCDKARMALMIADQEFEYQVVDVDYTLDWLIEFSGRREVPVVAVGGECIGGYTELREFLNGLQK